MVQVTELSHVGFNAHNLSYQAEFYNDRWGLQRVDEQGGELFFRADGPDHHVLTLHTSKAPGLHHFAFEVASVDDLDRALDELSALGLTSGARRQRRRARRARITHRQPAAMRPEPASAA